MESSSNSSGRSQARRSDASRLCTDHPLSSFAPAPPSKLCVKVHLSTNDAYTRQNPDAERIFTAHTFLDKGRPPSAYEKFMSDDTQRPSDPDLQDAAISTKRIRTDDQLMGGSISRNSKKLALNEEKTAKRGFGSERGEVSSSRLQAEPIDGLPAAKKAENSSTKSDRGAQKNGDKGRLPVGVGTRLPHKKAFKTMRFLSEVRDCLTEKPEHESHSCVNSRAALERRSPPKSLQRVDVGKDYQAKGTLAECSSVMCDFPFILPPVLKRARSSRDRRAHKKSVIKERHPEDATVKVEEERGLGVLEVGGETDCRGSVSQETVPGEEDADASIKVADAAAQLPTSVEEGMLKVGSVTCPFSIKSERREVGDAAERRGALSLQTKAEIVEYMDCSAAKELAACMHLSESMSQQASEFNDEGKVPKSLNDGDEGSRACHQASHGMVQGVLAGDRASGERAHEMVRDMSGGHWSAGSAVGGGLLATKLSYSADILDKDPVGEGHPEIQRIESNKGRDTRNEPLLNLSANPADIQSKQMKGLFAMVDCKNEEHAKRAPGLQVNSTHDCEDNIAHKLSDHVHQRLTQKQSRLGTFQLSLAPPGTEAGYALNANNGPAGALQLPAHTHVQSQTQTQNLSQSQTQTLSDGYTASFSQSLYHNPSCSLNCFSGENQELSCGASRHISQGNENVSQRGWPTASANEDDSSFYFSEDKSKQGHGFAWAIQNGSIISKNIPSGQKAPIITRTLNLHADDHLTRQCVKHEDLTGRAFRQEEGAQHQAVAPREPWSKPLAQTSKAHHPASLFEKHVTAESECARGDENKLEGSFGLQEIATEPIALMAQRMQELPESFLESLRSLARDLLRKFEKRGEFLILQSLIKNRTDLMENTLLHAQHTQLEILVALKTGEQGFVQVDAKPLTYKVLTEVFLQTRCRNVACQQSLPVDGCECKVCSQKSGFCHECMCVVCSKFDSDNQTCRWLGCDFCMHWCHADCGLRMLHIAPAQSNKGVAGDTEMQYRCVACGHSTELFGFVKKAFHLFAGNWGAETLTKELDCVRRIFHGSDDVRGQRLCKKVEVMLEGLDMKVEIAEIRHSMLQYFNEADLDGGKVCKAANKPSTFTQLNKPFDGKGMAMQEAGTQVAPMVENKKLVDERKMMQPCESEISTEENKDAAELRICKRAEIDHIQSMVRLKRAEAKMLQLRADEAHQQARGLQHIIHIKQDKIEGDYVSKYTKLKLNEAEEKRSKRFLELQALERAHLDYQSMKLRMDTQIKDLAMKMGRTSWQFA